MFHLHRRPNISALGEVLGEVTNINRRLQPYIEQFRQIVSNDAEMTQEVSSVQVMK